MASTTSQSINQEGIISEMLKLEREQEALLEKERLIKEQMQLNKNIELKKLYMEKKKNEDQIQIQAAESFMKDFDSNYVLNIDSKQEKVFVGRYDYSDSKYTELWSDFFERKTAVIVRGKYSISVEKHIVYSSSYSLTGIDRGWKMKINGPGISYQDSNRWYKNPKSVDKKINDVLKASENQKAYEEKKKDVFESTIQKLKDLYPDAVVVGSVAYERNTHKRNYEVISYNQATVTLKNGIELKFRVFSDGSLSRTDITFNVKDGWATLELMNQITIPQELKK